MALEVDHREPPGVAVLTVLAATLGFFLFVAVGLALLGFYYRHVLDAEPVPTPTTTFPAPRSTESTFPVFPRSRPAITTTVSPLRILLFRSAGTMSLMHSAL